MRSLQLQAIVRLEYVSLRLGLPPSNDGLPPVRMPDIEPLLEADEDSDSETAVPAGEPDQLALDRVGLLAVRFLQRLMFRLSSDQGGLKDFLETVLVPGYPQRRAGRATEGWARAGRRRGLLNRDIGCACRPYSTGCGGGGLGVSASTYKQDLMPLLRQIAGAFDIDLDAATPRSAGRSGRATTFQEATTAATGAGPRSILGGRVSNRAIPIHRILEEAVPSPSVDDDTDSTATLPQIGRFAAACRLGWARARRR